ncbi:VOC family protein [Streptomyces termitum]|uniref:VOC family protein n=1 Tax=Streptomyces termitum TaxID=67368 RepID=UPI0033B099D2
MASIKKFQVTIDCADPVRLARFWCEVLGYVIPAEDEDEDPATVQYFGCVDPTGEGPRVLFQRVPEGKVVKNRVHLDVRAGTGLVGEERLAVLTAERDRLVALGAVCDKVLLADGENESCINMRDIEGNEFCLD